jgi:uncharacterized protein YcgI (DUF1989 family)
MLKLVDTFTIPAKTGKAFQVRQGQHLRVIELEGPQVCDFDAFNFDDPREWFSSAVTRSRGGVHPTTGATLWSRPPWERVILTIVADTVQHQTSPAGARGHDLIFSRCSGKRQRDKYGRDTHGCQENLAAAIEPFGLDELCVHDPLNLFMKTGLTPEGKMFHEPPDAKAGDYVELRAEINCLIAISACPGVSSGGSHRPLGIEIYDVVGEP